jgi:hypothetical protein
MTPVGLSQIGPSVADSAVIDSSWSKSRIRYEPSRLLVNRGSRTRSLDGAVFFGRSFIVIADVNDGK